MLYPVFNIDDVTPVFLSRPAIINRVPADNEQYVDYDSIEFDLFDNNTAQGIDTGSLNVWVNDVPAIVNGILVSPFNAPGSVITGSNWLKHVKIIPIDNFGLLSGVKVKVEVKTMDNILGVWEYNFSLIDRSKPRIEDVKPVNRREIDVYFSQGVVSQNAVMVEAEFLWGIDVLENDNNNWKLKYISCPWVVTQYTEPFNVGSGTEFKIKIDDDLYTLIMPNNSSLAVQVANDFNSILPDNAFSWARNGKVYLASKNINGSIQVLQGGSQGALGFDEERKTARLRYDIPEGNYNISIRATYPSGIISEWVLNKTLLNNERDFVLEETESVSESVLDVGRYVLSFDKQNAIETFIPAFTGKFKKATKINSNTVRLTLEQEFSPKAKYILEINDIYDIYGNEIDPDFRTFVFEGYSQDNCRDFNFYNLFPEFNRRQDESFDFKRFASVINEVANTLLTDQDEFLDITDITKASDTAIDEILNNLGNPFVILDLDSNKKRQLIRVLVSLYKEKGTKKGLENALRFFLGFGTVEVLYYWGAGWHLGVTGQTELGNTTVLNASSLYYRYSFKIKVDRILTEEERNIVRSICQIMKTAHTHCIGIEEPQIPFTPDHWQLPYSHLGIETILHRS